MVNGTISNLHNKNGEVAFPVTVAKAVYMNNGTTTIETEINKKANQVDLELEKIRIDNLVVNHSNTEGNAELLDIRAGQDGMLYTSAGEAVRNQFKDIANDIKDIEAVNIRQDNEINTLKASDLNQNNKVSAVEDKLKWLETKDEVQDIYINGLFNENSDKRLTIEGTENNLKLEGSKKGLATVDKITGNTLVNILPSSIIKSYQPSNENFILTSTWLQMPIWDKTPIKPNTKYTFIVNVLEKPSNVTLKLQNNAAYIGIGNTSCGVLEQGINIKTITTTSVEAINNWGHNYLGLLCSGFTENQSVVVSKNIMLLEGDNTTFSYPYFEGLKSTFEDGLVTQDMVNTGVEQVENLGKYKTHITIKGKNLFNISKLSLNTGVTYGGYLYPKTTPLVMSVTDKDTSINISDLYLGFSKSGQVDDTRWCVSAGKTVTNGIAMSLFNEKNSLFISFYPKTQATIDKLNARFNIQLEEGAVATPYEPYYEHTETVYLNSPLLKGDEIIAKEDGLYHYHKMGKIVLDNNSNISFHALESGGKYSYTVQNLFCKIAPVVCDKFKNVTVDQHPWAINEDSVAVLNDKRITFQCDISSLSSLQQWLQANPVTVVYELAEPYYEKISDYSLALEIPNSATLTIESVIPCTSIKATYTGGIPSVYSLEKTGEKNTEDITDTQIAVDYLLMTNASSDLPAVIALENTGLTAKGIDAMAAYLANRIVKGFLDYESVVLRYPEFKEGIDSIIK